MTRRKLLSREIVPENNLVIAITRGSTPEQQLTLEAQANGIRRFCELKNLDLGNRLIVDRGTSTGIPFFHREKVREALRLMAEIRCQQMVLTRVDRAFRSIEEMAASIRQLYTAGVIVHFSEQDIPKPSSASGKMLLQQLGVFAEFEKDLRRERQLEANEVQRMLGQKCGQNPPYGWRGVLDPAGRRTKAGAPGCILEPIPEQQEVLREILRRHDDGESDAYIAAVLNEARIPTAKAGQTIRYRGVEKQASGKWRAATVYSVRSFARSESFAFLAETSIQ